MNTILTVSIIDTICALCFMGCSVLLMKRKIPINPVFGARFKASFKSDRNWYEINEYGGKCLFWASLPILAYGIIGIVLNRKLEDWYLWVGMVDMLLVLGIAAFAVYSKAQEIDHFNSQQIRPGN